MDLQADLDYGKARERAGAEELVSRLWPGATLVSGHTYSDIDFLVVLAGQLVAFLEVKARRNSSSAFPTTICSFEKHDAARWGMRYWRVPTLALVIFTDRAGTFRLDERPNGKEYVGRDDRGGQGREHAFYTMERITWHDGLVEAVNQRVSPTETSPPPHNAGNER